MERVSVQIHTPAAPHLDRTFSYGLTGCKRVEHLIDIYREARQKTGRTRGRTWTHLSDILRAAVVLCHANLDQVLRDLIAIEAEWTPEFLQKIPLLDTKHVRADRFSFADLVAFGDRPVADVISEAVWSHLSRRSFTEVSDVADVLSMCRLDLSDYREFFPGIQELMERRHHIAHTADFEEDSPGRGKQMARSISADKVARWNRNSLDFIWKLSEITLPKRSKQAMQPTAGRRAERLKDKL